MFDAHEIKGILFGLLFSVPTGAAVAYYEMPTFMVMPVLLIGLFATLTYLNVASR